MKLSEKPRPSPELQGDSSRHKTGKSVASVLFDEIGVERGA